MDIFQRKMWFAYEDHSAGGIVELTLDRVHEIIESNNSGKKPDKLEDFFEKVDATPVVDYENVVGQDSIDRFDSRGMSSKRKNNKKGKSFRGKNRNQNQKPKA